MTLAHRGNTTLGRRSLTLAVALVCLALINLVTWQGETHHAQAATSSSLFEVVQRGAEPPQPTKVVGHLACLKCHAAETEIWKRTPHAKTFEELHRRPEARQIAGKLGLTSIKHSGRCNACHYTLQQDPKRQDETPPHAIAGVSCESCHGPAADWLERHHDYGGEEITRLTESAQHRHERITSSIQAGMRNPANVYLIAQSCLRCHSTADEELVNVGGHSAGSLDFEFVSWSQGSLRHNFVHSDGKVNETRSQEKLRVMFVAGMIAELEASLRATAEATTKATYGVTSAKRAARAAARLQSVHEKVQAPCLTQILDVFRGVELKLNNREQLVEAARQVAALGYRFAEEADGQTLTALDAFIPQPGQYK